MTLKQAYLGDEALKYGDAWEQYLVADQPTVGVIEQCAEPVGARPAQHAQPASEEEPDAAVGELAVAIAGANLGCVPSALFALPVQARRPGRRCRVCSTAPGTAAESSRKVPRKESAPWSVEARSPAGGCRAVGW